MIAWSIVFLVIALCAGALGLSGIVGTAATVAWSLFAVGLGLAFGCFRLGRIPQA